MTCNVCKQDFCWFCLGKYSRTRYYHAECPTGDCNIRFNNQAPVIIGLPPGIFLFIDIIIYNSYPNIITSTRSYNILNTHRLLTAPSNKTSDNTITLHCSSDGIIKKFNSRGGEFTFKQENRAEF